MDNKSYDIYVDIYEKVGLNPSYENSEPHEYLITTETNLKSTDTKEKWFSVIESCVKQCIEIDTLPENSTIKIVCSIDSKNKKEFQIYIEKLSRTKTASSYIIWGDKIPHIFKIDWNNSKLNVID